MCVITLKHPIFNRVTTLFFIFGLLLTLTVFIQPHDEGDELIYQTLVQQLVNGKGYTLHDTDIVNNKHVDPLIYDTPLFFHPPGGPYLFWLFTSIFNIFGFPVAQIFSFALFYWSMSYLAYVCELNSKLEIFMVACLSAFSPLMAHVTTKYWLDGPLLAFATLSTVLFLLASKKNSLLLSILAGVVLGYSSLIKVTAFLIVPGLIILAGLMTKNFSFKKNLKLGIALLIPAFMIQIPWEMFQWIELGTPFSTAAGRPNQSLLENNNFIYYVTVERKPWVYLTLLPRIIWTLIPCLLMLITVPVTKKIRAISFAWFIWIAIVIGAHVLLGFAGYSKVMRYVILMTPAYIILFTLLYSEAVNQIKVLKNKITFRTCILSSVLFVATLSIMLEVATGIRTSCLYKPAIIIPFWGL